MVKAASVVRVVAVVTVVAGVSNATRDVAGRRDCQATPAPCWAGQCGLPHLALFPLRSPWHHLHKDAEATLSVSCSFWTSCF